MFFFFCILYPNEVNHTNTTISSTAFPSYFILHWAIINYNFSKYDHKQDCYRPILFMKHPT